MHALCRCVISIASITPTTIISTKARITLTSLRLLINEVIIGEPECCSLEIALLTIRIYHVAEMTNLVLRV